MRLFVQEPAAPQAPLPSPSQVSDVLREILADPEFATLDASPRRTLIEWFFARLAEAWDWLRRLVGEDGTGAAEIVVIVVALAALIIMLKVASGHAPRVLGGKGDGDDEEAPTPVTAREWLRVASRQAGQGQFRPAATALYQGFLLNLDQQGALSFHSSKTPGDYALEIARGGAGATAGATARAGAADTAGRAGAAAGDGDTTSGEGAAASARSRFLASFQDYSFGHEEPTPAGYADLERMARDAGCPAGGPEGDAPESEAVRR